MTLIAHSYKRHRFPPEIIAHSVWLYHRFNLSFREVEEMLLERGIDVSYETLRRWVAKFGSTIARGLRRRQPRPGDVWLLDEVRVKIGKGRFWLWRAVDQDGIVLDEILQRRRDKRAAKRLLVKLLKKYGTTPKRFITDKLRFYDAAKRELVPEIEHRSHKGLNNHAENSHLPFRKRERAMQAFRSPGGCNASSRPSLPRETASPFQPAAAQPGPFATIASKLSTLGVPPPGSHDVCTFLQSLPDTAVNVTTSVQGILKSLRRQ